MRSCTDLLTGRSGSGVLEWNNTSGPPLTSTITFDQTVTRDWVVTVVTSIGTVTDGLFEGDSFVLVETIPNLQFLACTTPAGMTSATGVTQLTITRV